MKKQKEVKKLTLPAGAEILNDEQAESVEGAGKVSAFLGDLAGVIGQGNALIGGAIDDYKNGQADRYAASGGVEDNFKGKNFNKAEEYYMSGYGKGIARPSLR